MTKEEKEVLNKKLNIYKERKLVIDGRIKEIKKILKKEEDK